MNLPVAPEEHTFMETTNFQQHLQDPKVAFLEGFGEAFGSQTLHQDLPLSSSQVDMWVDGLIIFMDP